MRFSSFSASYACFVTKCRGFSGRVLGRGCLLTVWLADSKVAVSTRFWVRRADSSSWVLSDLSIGVPRFAVNSAPGRTRSEERGRVLQSCIRPNEGTPTDGYAALSFAVGQSSHTGDIMKHRIKIAALAMVVAMVPLIAFAYVDGDGNEYEFTTNADGAILKSSATTLYLRKSCDANSPQYGKGTWGWANGGFSVEFKTTRIGFPRQEIEIDNDGGCRL